MLCVVRALWCPGYLGPLVLLVLVAGIRGWRGGGSRDVGVQRSIAAKKRPASRVDWSIGCTAIR